MLFLHSGVVVLALELKILGSEVSGGIAEDLLNLNVIRYGVNLNPGEPRQQCLGAQENTLSDYVICGV